MGKYSVLELQIEKLPEGFFPFKTHTKFPISIKIPSDEFLKENPPSMFMNAKPRMGGLILFKDDLLAALTNEDREEAEKYFTEMNVGIYVTIPARNGNLLGNDPPGYSREELLEYMRIRYGYRSGWDLETMSEYMISGSGICPVCENGKYFLRSWTYY